MDTPELTDETRTCRHCGRPFLYSAEDQELVAAKGWKPPARCKGCRAAARANPDLFPRRQGLRQP